MDNRAIIRLIDLNNGQEMLELLALQTAAYMKEAEMIGLTDIPPFFDSPAAVRASGDLYYGLYEDGMLAGAVSIRKAPPAPLAAEGEEQGESLHIGRLMVHPGRMRQGIGSRLLQHAAGLADSRGLSLNVLAVATHQAALALYRRFGFVPVRQHPAVNGLMLEELVRPAATAPLTEHKEAGPHEPV